MVGRVAGRVHRARAVAPGLHQVVVGRVARLTVPPDALQLVQDALDVLVAVVGLVQAGVPVGALHPAVRRVVGHAPVVLDHTVNVQLFP